MVMRIFFKLVPMLLLVARRLAEARDQDSDGGRKVTREEAAGIVDEVLPLFGEAVTDVVMDPSLGRSK